MKKQPPNGDILSFCLCTYLANILNPKKYTDKNHVI